jgi:hypothetical protein
VRIEKNTCSSYQIGRIAARLELRGKVERKFSISYEFGGRS